MSSQPTTFRYIRRFSELTLQDIPLVGGKNASLGEMYSALSSRGISVPNGFATTAEAFNVFIKENHLFERIEQVLKELDKTDVEALAAAGAKIRQWIIRAKLPDLLLEELDVAYHELSAEYGHSPDVAVRSSATAEDLPTASFAGQQDTYLNIRGTENLFITCKRVFSSLFTNRAISYRVDQGFEHMDVALSIGVQKMVRSDRSSSGVMFTLDTESGFRDVVFITGAYGLGENIVQGKVNPDEFYVFKPTLQQNFKPLIRRHLGSKLVKMIYGDDAMAGTSTRNVKVPQDQRERFCIDDEEVIELARCAVEIESYYSELHGRSTPMDIEWAKDGTDGKLYIVQARPETVEATNQAPVHELYKLKERGKILVQGKSVGRKIATGNVRVIMNTERMHELQEGEILVTDITDPDWEPVMKRAGAIVTNRGGRTCHAAIIARELGIPAVVGTHDATQILTSGGQVTVSCAEGDIGNIYGGILAYSKESYSLDVSQKTRTKLMLNIANPEVSFDVNRLPNDGVGLVRLEFIINSTIGIHPQALMTPDKLDDKTRAKIQELVPVYSDWPDFYVSQLSEGVATIAAAFYPKPVIVRMSDFKSNEYAALLGGDLFEPDEENPMIGFRGASRYHSETFIKCFELECNALKRVREEMGLNNVKVMLPFVRTVDELKQVLEIMQSFGLRRGENGLSIVLMCEIPANVMLADEFLEHCDGFSIGSNDLTQLTLGVDRDSGLLTGYDERNPAVLKMLKLAIDACVAKGKYVGICGQAPSDFPEMTRWLVEQGIESISLNPDSLYSMRELVLQVESETKLVETT